LISSKSLEVIMPVDRSDRTRRMLTRSVVPDSSSLLTPSNVFLASAVSTRIPASFACSSAASCIDYPSKPQCCSGMASSRFSQLQRPVDRGPLSRSTCRVGRGLSWLLATSFDRRVVEDTIPRRSRDQSNTVLRSEVERSIADTCRQEQPLAGKTGDQAL
jgi:hypothetical protein